MTDSLFPWLAVLSAFTASFYLSRTFRGLGHTIEQLKRDLQAANMVAENVRLENEALRLALDKANERTPDVLRSP